MPGTLIAQTRVIPGAPLRGRPRHRGPGNP